MGSHLKRIDLGGAEVWVEVRELTPSRGTGQTDEFTRTSDSAGRTLPGKIDDAIDKVDLGPTLKKVMASVHESLIDSGLEELSVEFSLGFGAKGGVIIASGEANMALKVNAKWKFPKKS